MNALSSWVLFCQKPERFVILSSYKSSERNLSSFFDIIKPWRIEHLQSDKPFASDPYFSRHGIAVLSLGSKGHNGPSLEQFMDPRWTPGPYPRPIFMKTY